MRNPLALEFKDCSSATTIVTPFVDPSANSIEPSGFSFTGLTHCVVLAAGVSYNVKLFS